MFRLTQTRCNTQTKPIIPKLSLLFLCVLFTHSALAQETAAETPETATPAPFDVALFVSDTPKCAATITHCFGIRLFMAQEMGVPVQSVAWVSAQIADANARFSLVDVNFEVVEAALLDDAELEMVSRLDRDRLGRKRHTKGTVQAYITKRLADVDKPGAEIYGVHWRDRSNGERRWVIVSSIAWSLTLGHELGHFFDLQHHRRYERSIMHEDRWRWTPEELSFAPAEQKTMQKARDRMRKDKHLTNLKKPSP